MRSVNADMLDEYTATNNQALEALVNEHGVEVRPFPPEVLAELKRLSDEVMQEQAAKDEQFSKIFASVKAFEKQVQAYHKISEQAMYDIRD
jgi:TRAP-type mannitol/chloroaromatic compound transport system substrate-binding protein